MSIAQGTPARRIGQVNSPWHHTDSSFPPASLAWALPPCDWADIRGLLDKSADLNIPDILTLAVGDLFAKLYGFTEATRFGIPGTGEAGGELLNQKRPGRLCKLPGVVVVKGGA